MKLKYQYSVFGLNFESEIEFPELVKSIGNIDVTIQFGKVPESLGINSYKGVCFEAIPGYLLLEAKNIARYFVSEGKKIVIDPFPQADESSIRLFLLGSVMGALLHQRGILPLHGNSVHINNGSVLIAGISGAGKSTIAAVLALKGFEPITDDITAIEFVDDIPVVLPGIPQLKLWHDSIIKMNITIDGLKRVRKELEKFYYPAKSTYNNVVLPLKKIYIMNINNLEGIVIKPLSGIEKFTVLKNHTYRYNYVKSMNLEINHFELVSRLASNIDISRLFRGKKGFDAEELAETVIKDLKIMNGK